MIEKYTEVLSQYELEILDVRRGRGAWLCETNQGLKLLREYKGTITAGRGLAPFCGPLCEKP